MRLKLPSGDAIVEFRLRTYGGRIHASAYSNCRHLEEEAIPVSSLRRSEMFIDPGISTTTDSVRSRKGFGAQV